MKLDCICGKILRGDLDPSLPLITERGGFVCNSMTRLRQTGDEIGRYAERLRDRCWEAGYESVALIPLERRGAVLGLLQFNDRRLDAFSPERVRLLEEVAEAVAPLIAGRRSEEDLRSFGEQQVLMVREIGHRVRNNLSAISGMLRLSVGREGSRLGDILDGIANRVEALSSVHELLTETGWRPPDLGRLCQRIIDDSVKVLAGSEIIDIAVDSPAIEISSRQAHELAVVLNELATNAVKHGRSGEGPIELRVRIERDRKEVRVEFKDNGPGYSPEVLDGEFGRGTIGLGLLRGIVSHSFRGELRLSNKGGAVATLTLWLEEPRATEKAPE